MQEVGTNPIPHGFCKGLATGSDRNPECRMASPPSPIKSHRGPIGRSTPSTSSLRMSATGSGPYLAIYLLTVQKWDEAQHRRRDVDRNGSGDHRADAGRSARRYGRAKRVVVAVAALVVTLASLLLPWLPDFFPVALSQATAHAAAAVLGPGLAAITLAWSATMLSPSASAATRPSTTPAMRLRPVSAGIAAYSLGPSAVFYLFAVNSMGSLVSVLAIPANAAIDHDLARGFHDALPTQNGSRNPDEPSGLRTFWSLAALCWCSPPAPCCSTWPMRQCCPWLARSLPCRTRTSERA